VGFNVNSIGQRGLLFSVAAVVCSGADLGLAQQVDQAAVVRGVDAAVKARIDGIQSYTVKEHYVVYRNKDEVHSVAEMLVQTVYAKATGKSYTILSQSGSTIIRNLVLGALLDNEKKLNEPGTREGSWIISANYDFNLKSGAVERLDGRDCLVLTMSPKRKAPYLIEGTIWVDAKDYSLVQLKGTASKSPSMLSGPAQVMRQYAEIDGFAEATHARAVSNSSLFGETVVKIDYQDYQIQLGPAK
jgi:outer membrane lipoprotein-sorting protein